MDKALVSPSGRKHGIRIVFCLRNLWYFRTLSSVIEALAARGHAVEICVLADDPAGQDRDGLRSTLAELQEAIARADGRLTYFEIARAIHGWTILDLAISRTIDFFYFRTGQFRGKPALVARAKGPPPLRKLLAHSIFQRPRVAKLMVRMLAAIERLLPPDSATLGYLADKRPDLVVFSPLIDLGLAQFSQLRAALALELRTALMVNSWDNLSSKSWLREVPDFITVWNEVQKKEAIEFHGVDPARVEVTGAAHFDRVFAFEPTVSRPDFMARVGLPPDRLLITYVASATFQGKRCPESELVRRWAKAIGSSGDPRLRSAAILVRPHPKRRQAWIDAQAALPKDVVIWPPVAENPVDAQSVDDYLNTLAHSDIIVGLNTSAFLEGAILQRPVMTFLDKQFRHSQSETFHFDYLVAGGNGILRVAENLEDHILQLAEAASNPRQSQQERDYLLRFLRPRGADLDATAAMADTIETQALLPAVRRRPPNLRRAVSRAILWPVAAMARRQFERDERFRASFKRV